MQIYVILLVFLTFVSNGNFENTKIDVMDNFNLIVSVAESLDIKFLVVLPLENFGNDSHVLLNLLKTTKFFFTVCKTSEFEQIKFAPFKTMIVYYPDLAGQNFCCSKLHFVDKFPLLVWLVITRKNRVDMENVYVPFNCLFIVAELEPARNNFVLTEKYQFHPESKIYGNDLGYWNKERGLELTNKTFFERRSNFYNETIMVKPYVMIRAGAAGENIPDFIPGSWESIMRRINASTKNTTNDSIFDALINFHLPRETQELPAVLTVRSVLVYKEETEVYSADQYLDPFSMEMWLCMLSWLGLSALGMFIVNKIKFITKENLYFFLLDSFYIIIQQGTQIAENASSFFTIKTLQLILSLIIFSCYGSVLISFVTISTFTPPFTDLEGVLQDGRYNIITLPDRGYEAFKYSRPGVVRELFEKHVPALDKLPKNFFQAFTNLCEGKHKTLVEVAAPLGPIAVRSLPRPCRVNHIKFMTLKMGYQMSVNNRFKEIIKVCVTKMLQSEVLGEIFWTKALNIYKTVPEEKFDSINFVQVSSLFMIFILGILLSVGGFALEIFRHKRSKAKEVNDNYIQAWTYYSRHGNLEMTA